LQTDSWQPETGPLTGSNGQETAFALDLASLIHDTCNMVSAMDLYCDLLAEPEVLSAPFRHYAGELRLVGVACRRLLERMAATEYERSPDLSSHIASSPSPRKLSRTGQTGPGVNSPGSASQSAQGERSAWPADLAITPSSPNPGRPGRYRVFLDGQPLESLADELYASQNLLSALAGSGVRTALSIDGGDRPISMTRDDFTRIMVNLVKNAAEAMPDGGHIQITLRDHDGSLLLTVEDTGHGIPEDSLEAVFLAGYSTHSGETSDWSSASGPASGFGPPRRRGLGLSIVRAIVAAAGGSVKAYNRMDDAAVRGATLRIELPCRSLRNSVMRDESSVLNQKGVEDFGRYVGNVSR